MKYMMAKEGTHILLGLKQAIGHDGIEGEHELCRVYSTAVDGYYVGSWFEGLGLIDVLFPEETTRELNEAEIDFFSGRTYQIASQSPFALNLTPSSTEKTEEELSVIVAEVLDKVSEKKEPF